MKPCFLIAARGVSQTYAPFAFIDEQSLYQFIPENSGANFILNSFGGEHSIVDGRFQIFANCRRRIVLKWKIEDFPGTSHDLAEPSSWMFPEISHVPETETASVTAQHQSYQQIHENVSVFPKNPGCIEGYIPQKTSLKWTSLGDALTNSYSALFLTEDDASINLETP